MVTLRFYDNESIEAQILGSLMVNGERYAAFLGEDKSVYLYKCKKKGNDYELTEITDKNEFKSVCNKMNEFVRR